jgi:hypothetical protein
MGTSWTCPHCNLPATLTGVNLETGFVDCKIENADGPRRLDVHFFVCPNDNCRRLTLSVWLSALKSIPGKPSEPTFLKQWRLLPLSAGKPMPSYVPAAVVGDYMEAYAIASLSPKASATLARRAIQGMIRDFWKVKPGRLVDEVAQIKNKVTSEVWEGIEAVRKVGNVGAHMETDIDVIVEVEPNEATLLLGLIELLVDEWYVTREERQRRLGELKQLAARKDAAKASAKQAE